MQRPGKLTNFGAVAVFVLLVAAACGEDRPTASSGDIARSGTALLTGSTFESGDGDLAPNTSTPPAAHDWNSPVETITCPSTAPGAGTNCGLDLIKSNTDDALGQGAKEDDPAPTIVHGSIPPNKDDLSRFYVNKEKIGGKVFLYLAWERSNLLGSAHMDFEFNQRYDPVNHPEWTSTNGVTPVRTAGDLLIDFDFSGSGAPVLQKHTWIVADGINTAALCEASNTLPCWDKAVSLGAYAEAQVNSTNVTDTNPPNAPFDLIGNTKNGINSTFGEAAINLTDSGIFPADVCKHFGAAWLKSRSSGNSFSSELKDFIAPIPVNISNCGTITIIKHTDPRGLNQSFSYTTSGSGLSGFSLNDNGNTTTTDSAGNTKVFQDLFAGSYTVAEAANPVGFSLTGISCNSTGTGTSATPSLADRKVDITLTAGGDVTCTFTNTQQLGAIKVTKVRKHAADGTGDHPHSGVKFTVNGVNKNTDANGVACFDGLPFASYTVHETVPAGYVIDSTSGFSANDTSVTVDNNATCSASSYLGETISFRNIPLTDITVSVDSKVAGGTSSTITCVKSTVTVASGSTDSTTGDGSVSATSLVPGTYVCTVVVDP